MHTDTAYVLAFVTIPFQTYVNQIVMSPFSSQDGEEADNLPETDTHAWLSCWDLSVLRTTLICAEGQASQTRCSCYPIKGSQVSLQKIILTEEKKRSQFGFFPPG